MKIEKFQEAFVTSNTFAVNIGTSPIASTNDNKANLINKNGNIAKLSALAERVITDANALIIEKDPNGNGFIYKSIDRTTGEIVRIWPREEVVSMLEAAFDSDARGAVVNKIA